MPKTLADGRILLTALTTPPANIAAITEAELASGKKISCRIMKSDYTLGPTGSDTVAETEMCKRGKGQAFGQSNYSGTITVFRYLDDKGVAVVEDDFAFEMFKEKGTQVTLVEREGPDEAKPWATSDEYSAYEVSNDDMQPPSDRFAGYIKRTVPLTVSNAALNKKVTAATP